MRLQRGPVQVWTDALDDELPVLVWSEIEAGPRPTRLELLRKRRKSVVYRLCGAGRGGSDVIAKKARWRDAVEERAAYELLDELKLGGLRYYGFAPGPERDYGWLFLEDAGSEPWDPDVETHRQAATRWLASLHAASSRSRSARALADRDIRWIREHLYAALGRVHASFTNPRLAPDARPVLDGTLEALYAVEACWSEIEEACDALPRALVHCDLQEHNVRVVEDGGGVRILVFDWEVAGWGLPAVDLIDLDLPAYAEIVRPEWPGVDLETLERSVKLGEILRGGVIPGSWAARSLVTTWPASAVSELAVYQRTIGQALDALGWRKAG
ncbi:MAG: phosphotransferase [Myxococcota bacterium]